VVWKTKFGITFHPLLNHVILRMGNAYFVNKYQDVGTPSIYLERLQLKNSYLVRIFNATRICHWMTDYH